MFRRPKHLLVLTLLALDLVAAGCGGASPTPAPTHTPAPTDTPAPTSTPTIALEAEKRVEEGGFAYRPVPGYTINGIDVNFFMHAPDADLRIGPTFLVIGGPTEETLTLDEAYADFTAFVGDAEFSEARESTLDGFPALTADLTVSVEAVEVAGRLVVARPAPNQGFLILGFAPAEKWESEVQALYDAVLASVRLFK